MAIQTSTLGDLEKAQNTVIASMRYTMEFSDPCKGLVTKYTLPKGSRSMISPKVAQMTAQSLTEGVDLVDTQDMGMTYLEMTTSEVGLKFILTDKILRQFNEDVFKVMGKQGGDAISRYVDRSIIALFSGLNGGTALGSDGASLGVPQAAGLAAWAKANKLPRPVYVVHHPYAMASLAKSTMAVGATYYAGILGGVSEPLYRNFWNYTIDGVGFFEDGNIDKIAGVDSGYGAVFSKDALCYLESLAPTTERERDASLRAWEVVTVLDYGVYELDDTYGAPAQYEIGVLETT